MNPDKIRRRIAFDRLLRASSIGESAWIDCAHHGHQARDPDTGACIICDPTDTERWTP